MKRIFAFRRVFASVTWFAALCACSGDLASSPPLPAGAPSASIVDPVAGIADPGDDPAVVAIENGSAIVCAGSLIAPDVVLTARHCVTLSMAAPASTESPCTDASSANLGDAASFGVLVGDNATDAEWRAYGRSILVGDDSNPCAADIAILLLDRTIDDIQPLVVRPTGVAQGDHVRTVGFRKTSESFAAKIVSDHVEVLETNKTQFRLHEVACAYGCGGPAVDESTGEVVGVLSGPAATQVAAPTAAGGATGEDIGTRTDAFSALVRGALAQGAPIPSGGTRAKTRKGPIDTGANCKTGGDCAAGVCVTDGSRQYCSRTCSADDRCPARFRCERSSGPEGPVSACAED